MQRESLPLPQRRQYSRQSSSKFFQFVEAVARQHEPTQTQLNNLERSYGATGEYLMGCDELRDLILMVHGQGSRMMGTLIRPTQWRPEGFDVDGVTRLRREAFAKYAGEMGPGRLIDDVFRPLDRYATAHGLGIKKWERCVTLKYADGMHVDITPIIEEPLISVPYGETHARVPDRELRRFDVTNPMGLVNSFNKAAKIQAVFSNQLILDSLTKSEGRAHVAPLPDADEVQERLLSRLVQLMKLHRNVSFGAPNDGRDDAAPKSVFITALAVAAYSHRAPIPHDSPLDLMLDVVQHMPLCLVRQSYAGGEYWHLDNPTAPGNNLASDMNTPVHQKAFLQWHARLVSHLEQILECIEGRLGLDVMLRLVEEAFGPRAAQAVQQLEQPRPSTGVERRSVIVGTAAATTLVMPVRAHTFYGH